MKHIGFKFPFLFAPGENRSIQKFKVKLAKDIEKIERVAVILKATLLKDEETLEFSSPVHLSLQIGNKKVPSSNIVLKDGCNIKKGISFIELYKDVYPAGQYISGYFEISRDAVEMMGEVSGEFVLVLKTTG